MARPISDGPGAYTGTMAVLLEANSLTKRYGTTIALDDVDFQVTDGITGLLGPNGARKNTAIKLSLGLIRPTAGSAEVMGRRPYDSPEVRERLGYMPEHDCLPPGITAAEFLSHMAQVSGLPPAQARTRAADILRHVGLEEERYRPIGQYSTGTKQRVKLGQALVHDPALVLLDEPTAGLDPSGRDDMLALVPKPRTAASAPTPGACARGCGWRRLWSTIPRSWSSTNRSAAPTPGNGCNSTPQWCDWPKKAAPSWYRPISWRKSNCWPTASF